jgi:hypothetical protein
MSPLLFQSQSQNPMARPSYIAGALEALPCGMVGGSTAPLAPQQPDHG